MDSLGGLFKFFYNIIPGALFIFGLQVLNINISQINPKSETVSIFWIIAIGIFFGFLGQAVMKNIKKKLGLNNYIFEKVIEKNNENGIYGAALLKLNEKELNANDWPNEDLFFTMDNYLRNNSISYVVNDFSEKAAFWANISLASGVLFIISLFHCNYYSLLLLLFTCFSFKFSIDYSIAEHDSVIKTYAQI